MEKMMEGEICSTACWRWFGEHESKEGSRRGRASDGDGNGMERTAHRQRKVRYVRGWRMPDGERRTGMRK